MIEPSLSRPLEWDRLARIVPGAPLALTVEDVAPVSVPDPYHALLVHAHHMTEVMERFHGSRVDVSVLARDVDKDVYRRAIILRRRDTQATVQFALAEYRLDLVSKSIREEILAERIPLGRILIDHAQDCPIEVKTLLRIKTAAGLQKLFGNSETTTTYGRTAHISCDRKPAFLVVEISAPLPIHGG